MVPGSHQRAFVKVHTGACRSNMQFSSWRRVGNNLTATDFAVTLAQEPKMTFKSQGWTTWERRLQLRDLIKVVVGCALAAGSSALTTARAQTDDIATYPNRPIRVT